MARELEVPVLVGSAIAVPILFGAPRERRYSLPHTRFLLHQPSGGAGGQASDLDGKQLDFSAGRQLSHNRGILVTNGRLHSAFIAALGELQG